MKDIVLEIKEYRQERQYDCWQAVTNIFHHYYRNEPYFFENPRNGTEGEDTVGDVIGVIQLATDRYFQNITAQGINGIRQAITNGDLVYACLDYGGGAFHATVIHGVGGSTPIFYLYDPEPRQFNSRWYTFSGSDTIYRDQDGKNFKIESLHRLG